MTRETLLLHTCCGPCSTAVLEQLMPEYEITLYFCNPNLDSEAEFAQRLEAQEIVAKHFAVPLETEAYDPQAFSASTTDLASEPEGGERCKYCFSMRLESTANLAEARGFSAFGTTLSVSPHKDADLLNEIGTGLSVAYDVPYLAADFKKKEGYRRSVAIARELQLYRQNYCGCVYSKP